MKFYGYLDLRLGAGKKSFSILGIIFGVLIPASGLAIPIELINPESLIETNRTHISYHLRAGGHSGSALDQFLAAGLQLNAIALSPELHLQETYNITVVAPNIQNLPRVSLPSGQGNIALAQLFPNGVPEEFFVFFEMALPGAGPIPIVQWFSMPLHITRRNVSMSSASEVARIGGISGESGNQSSMSFFAPRTSKIPLTSRAEGEAFVNGDFFFALQNVRTGELQIPQQWVWDWYPSISGRHQARAIRLDFLDSKAPYEGSYEEYKVLKVVGQTNTPVMRPSNAVANFVQQEKRVLLRAETNTPGEVYEASFSLADPSQDTTTEGNMASERRHSLVLRADPNLTNIFPQALIAQVFTRINKLEEELTLSLNIINSIATPSSGMGHDDFYFRKLQICVEGAKGVYPWNPNIDSWNRGFYNYGSVTNHQGHKCLNLVKETSSGHLFLSGQSYSFLDIHFPLTDRQKHRSEAFSKEPRHFVVLNDRNLPNNYWNQDAPHMYGAGIPHLNAALGYPQSTIHNRIANVHSHAFVGGNQSQCYGANAMCALNLEHSPWVMFGPADGNATGGAGKDSSTQAVVLAHNGRGSPHLDKAMDTILLGGISALGRQISDGLVKPDGRSVNLEYMFNQVGNFWKCDVAPNIFFTASPWHPERDEYRSPAHMVQTQQLHESNAAPVPYYTDLRRFENPHNNQHSARMTVPATAADITFADPAIRFLTNAHANWDLVCRTRQMNAFPNSETFQNYLAEAQSNPGTGVGMGRDLEQTAIISRLLTHYPELPNYLRTQYVDVFGEIGRLATRPDGLLMKRSSMSNKLRSVTPSYMIDGFVSEVATRLQIPNCDLNSNGELNPNCTAQMSPSTEVYLPWEGALASIALSTLWKPVLGHPDSNISSQAQNLKEALCENTAAYYDTNMLYTNNGQGAYYIAWSSFREIEDTATSPSQFHEATWAETMNWNYVYTAINQYTDQDAAYIALQCPAQRAQILTGIGQAGSLPTDPVNEKQARAIWSLQRLQVIP